jgi:hypothetical protein
MNPNNRRVIDMIIQGYSQMAARAQFTEDGKTRPEQPSSCP